MVLISHKKKFVFIKNIKVAGSALEAVLSKYCYHDEKICKLIEARTCSNNGYRPYLYEINTKDGFISGGGKTRPTDVIKHKLAQHARSILIQNKFPNSFDNYFKFCIVRNPYDRIVSRFNWDKRCNILNKNVSFKQYILHQNLEGRVNRMNEDWFDRCTIYGKPCCDYYIKFDNLEDGIKEVFNKLNINENPNIKKININPIKPNIHYSKYYDDKLKEIVYNNCKEEIEYFNWNFESE